MKKIGLTGNIGCGKSSISNILKKNNYKIIDADLISRKIYDNKKLLEIVIDIFGMDVINKNGVLDRKKMGRIVFEDKEKLKILNNITVDYIQREIMEQFEKYKEEDIVILDAALLFESGYKNIMYKNIVVTCDETIQVQRIMNRDNCTEEFALKKINSQMKQDEKVKLANYVIDNSDTIEELEKKVYKLISYLENI